MKPLGIFIATLIIIAAVMTFKTTDEATIDQPTSHPSAADRLPVSDQETANKPRNSATSKDDQIKVAGYRFYKNLPLDQVPKELHSKSAIEVKGRDIGKLLTSSGASISFPLTEHRLVNLQVSKIVRQSENDLAVFGKTDTAEKSHFKMIFKNNSLISGTITFFESGDLHIIKKIEHNRIISALVDPDIDIRACGCDPATH